jgi:hypothetical protein
MITIIKIIATIICDFCILTSFLYRNNCWHFRVPGHCFRDTRILPHTNRSERMYKNAPHYYLKNRWEVWYQQLPKRSLNFYFTVVESRERCRAYSIDTGKFWNLTIFVPIRNKHIRIRKHLRHIRLKFIFQFYGVERKFWRLCVHVSQITRISTVFSWMLLRS